MIPEGREGPVADCSAERDAGQQPVRRAYLDVADRLCSLLAAEGYGPGDRIPAEAELVKRLEAGRPLVREALVALQVTGCVEVRTGAGMFLRSLPSDTGIIGIQVDLGPSLVEQLDTRLLVECELVNVATSLITAEEIAHLDHLVDRMAANHPYDDPALGREFHLVLARASRRTLLVAVLESLLDLRQGRMWSVLRENLLTPAHYAQTIIDRRRIVDHLRRGDGYGARHALATMLERIHAVYFESEAAGISLGTAAG